MKRIVVVLLIVCCTATAAFAEWIVDFKDNYANKGIDVAVEQAMKVGIAPDAILQNGLTFENLNPENLIKALYCAGANGDDIKAAADKYGISDLIVVAGFKKSVEECADRVTDTQAYTPAVTPAPAASFAGLPSAGGGGTSFASPSTF